MKSVGAGEAKSQLPRLLKRAARGEKILITRHGRPMAMLVPAEDEDDADKDREDEIRAAIQAMREVRRGNILGDDLTIRDLIEEGRR